MRAVSRKYGYAVREDEGLASLYPMYAGIIFNVIPLKIFSVDVVASPPADEFTMHVA